MKILLVHLVSLGDCLMATTIAKQIKHDYPNCILTWAISYKCKQVIQNNPYVDIIWEIIYETESPHAEVWYKVKTEALRRKNLGLYDEIFYTQIFPDNLHNVDGTTRTSTFANYPKPITVSIEPVLYLIDSEIANVAAFSKKNQLHNYKNIILFECAPSSNQSFINPALAKIISAQILEKLNNTIIILSSHLPISDLAPGIIDGSSLTYRENAELSKYCTYFIGCSSGITWLLTSDWAKKLPSMLLLTRSNIWYSFASLKYDFAYWNIPTSNIIETDCTNEYKISQAIVHYINNGKYPKNIETHFKPSLKQIVNLYNLDSRNSTEILQNFKNRNGGKFIILKFYYFYFLLKFSNLISNFSRRHV